MKRTPLYQEHVRLGAKMVEFGGWEMPLNYPSGIIVEHLATRKFGGLFDISHMGRFLVTGQDAVPFLQYVLTNNSGALLPGQSQYTILPTETGGAIDDAYLYRISEKEYLLVVNAANMEKDWVWLEGHKSRFPNLNLKDSTSEIAMLSLQGPGVKEILAEIVGGVNKLPEPAKNRLTTARVSDTTIIISRTGYTGEPVGFELFVPRDAAVRLFNLILKDNKKTGILPVGLGARDTLRLEAGLPLYGHELGLDANGQEIPIFATPAARFAVSLSKLKGDFIGREALERQFQEIQQILSGSTDQPRGNGTVRKVIMPICLLTTTGGIARAGYPVSLEGAPVGYVTSGTAVPYWVFQGQSIMAKPGKESHIRTIGLAYLDSELREEQRIEVSIRDRVVEARIVKRNMSSAVPPFARPIFPVGDAPVSVPENRESMENLASNLIRKVCLNNTWRQKKAINLIPSEQSLSPLVRLLTIADPIGRYAEHRQFEALGNTDVFYYQGTEFIAGIESEVIERMKEFLHCSQVEVRAISGQMANTAVFSGLLDYINGMDKRAEPRRLRTVMNHHIAMGGHLSSQPMGALRNYISIDPVTEKWSVMNFPISKDNPYKIDLNRVSTLIETNKPEIVVLGKSLMLHKEPVRELVEILKGVSPKPIVIYDAAHVFGLLGPHFQEPLHEGADIVTASTHKTYFGTQRGIIASNIDEQSRYFGLWSNIVSRTFPGSVSNHHLGTLLGLLMAAHEMKVYGGEYQKQVIANAKAFATSLAECGLRVEGDPSMHFTETHQVLLRVGYARGMEMAGQLEKNNIIVNYQALPDDEGFSASSGIRMGVQEMTRFGMVEEDFKELAGYLADVLEHGKDVAEGVSEFRAKFLEMKFCLPVREAKPMVEGLLGCVLGGYYGE